MVLGSSSSDDGQSAPIAVALLLAITLLGTTAVVALGANALGDTEQQAEVDQAEHGMTQFDSRAAEVALSDTSVQSVDFSPGGGTFRVEPNAGTITVVHTNYDGGSNNDGNFVDDGDVSGDDDEQIYQGTLGATVYENRNTKLAYQGGGVWRIDNNGGARMVSPPEFHYRSGTLTLPVIQTRTPGTGVQSGSGDVTAVIRRQAASDRKFPIPGVDYNGGTSPATADDIYQNPLSKGVVRVTVQSEYYEAWAEYFRTRTDGTVNVDDANQKVTLVFGTVGATGPFDIPADQNNGGGSKEVRGMAAGHSLTSFDFTIVGKDDQNSRFKNLRWGIYVEKGNQQFEIAVGGGNTYDCGDEVKPVIYYSPDGGNTFQSWKAQNGWDVVCTNTDGDAKTEAQLSLEFTGDPRDFEYQQISGSELSHFNNQVGSADFDTGISDDLASDATHGTQSLATGSPGTVKASDFIIAHYYTLLGPDFELKVDDQQSGTGAGVDEGDPGSAGYVDYTGGDRVVTYLHITENTIEVRYD